MKQQIEKQLVNLVLSEKLKKLGVPQDSQFYWTNPGMQNGMFLVFGQEQDDDVSAFGVAELGEMLPYHLPKKDPHENLKSLEFYCASWEKKSESRWGTGTWGIQYVEDLGQKCFHFEEADTEADARAKMLIYLLENKLIII